MENIRTFFLKLVFVPVLDFWWCLIWFSKPEWAALFMLGGGVLHIPEITLWCNTWQPLGGHHGNQAVRFHIPVSRYWWGSQLESIVAWHDRCSIQTELGWLRIKNQILINQGNNLISIWNCYVFKISKIHYSRIKNIND